MIITNIKGVIHAKESSRENKAVNISHVFADISFVTLVAHHGDMVITAGEVE